MLELGLQRKRDERDPAASLRSQAERVLICSVFFFFFKRNELQQKSSRKFESLTQSSFGVEGGNTCAASLVKESGASYSHLHI